MGIGKDIFRAEDELPLLQKALEQYVPELSWVAVEDKKVVGFILVCKKITKEYYEFLNTIPNCYELAFLGISLSSQGKGIGSRLIDRALQGMYEVCKQFHCWLIVDKINEPAMKLYKKFGFRQWAEIKKDAIQVPGWIMGMSYRRFEQSRQEKVRQEKESRT
jgi:ribosomal protein S18 acetylase RimI-like enzyme